MDVPCVGLGTLGLRESAEAAIQKALSIHGEHYGKSPTLVNTALSLVLDTGEHYGNLALVGSAIKSSERKPFLIVKLSGMPSGDYESVQGRLKAILDQLGVKNVDLCLVHWPGLCTWDPTDMAPLTSPADFREKASSWDEFCENISSAWSNMQKLREAGLCTQIGTSNFYAHHLEELAKKCGGAVPYANEIYIDATNQEHEFVTCMQKQGIRVLAYRPVAYKPYPEEVSTVAKRLGDAISPQTVILAWLLKRGIWPLVKCRGEHIDENMSTPMALQARLTDEDLEELKKGDVGARLLQDWFAKVWKMHGSPAGISEEDVQMLVGMGVEEGKARTALEKCGGDLDAAMEVAFGD